MKICLIGPGIMPIPPTGWGAVEILVHDVRCELEKLGHEVTVVNVKDKNEIVKQANETGADFTHIHYDGHADVIPHLVCKNVAITSHYGYLEQPAYWQRDGYIKILNNFAAVAPNIIALSPGIANVYSQLGFNPERLFVVHNGARGDLFRFDVGCEYPLKSLYLGKIEPRKRQYIFQNIPNLFYAGNHVDGRFNISNERYLGEWTKDYLYDNLTKYANLALLSDGENHPLVCLEAMMAGLGVVASEFAVSNLDTSLPFIDVISESQITNTTYVNDVLAKNREVSVNMRQDIRDYAEANFRWDVVVENRYLDVVDKICKQRV